MQHVPHRPRTDPGRGHRADRREVPRDPASRDGLRKLLDDAGLKPSEAIRKKEAVFKELALTEASEDELLEAMVDNPILIERPIVVTDKGTVLARPAEKVRQVL